MFIVYFRCGYKNKIFIEKMRFRVCKCLFTEVYNIPYWTRFVSSCILSCLLFLYFTIGPRCGLRPSLRCLNVLVVDYVLLMMKSVCFIDVGIAFYVFCFLLIFSLFCYSSDFS